MVSFLSIFVLSVFVTGRSVVGDISRLECVVFFVRGGNYIGQPKLPCCQVWKVSFMYCLSMFKVQWKLFMSDCIVRGRESFEVRMWGDFLSEGGDICVSLKLYCAKSSASFPFSRVPLILINSTMLDNIHFHINYIYIYIYTIYIIYI